MRFPIKLALDSIIPLATASRYLSPSSAPTDTTSPKGLRKNSPFRRIFHFLWGKIVRVKHIPTRNTLSIDLMPLIKSTTYIENCSATHDLTGRSILCVGGRAKHYPIYRHLVEASGGRLMTFHGNANDSIDQLLEQLEEADMLICPVDCVNHEAYFTTKHYCKRSGKPCVLLDRSQIATFKNGIEILATMAIKNIQSSVVDI